MERNMKIIFVLVSLFTYLLTSMNNQAHANESVTVLTENDWTPYSLPDGSGISNSLIRAAFNKVDIDTDFIVYPFNRVLDQLKNGQALAGVNLAKTAGQRDHYNYGQQFLFTVSSHFYVLKGSPLLKLNGKEQLDESKTIGAIAGYDYGDFIDLNKKGLNIQRVRSHEQNIKKLIAGRIDLLVLYEERANQLMSDTNFSDKVVRAFPVEDVEIYTAFSKTFPKSKHYMDLFDKGLEIIKSNGDYELIFANCGEKTTAKATPLCL